MPPPNKRKKGDLESKKRASREEADEEELQGDPQLKAPPSKVRYTSHPVDIQAPTTLAGTRAQKQAQIQASLPDLQEWDPSTLPEGFFVVFEGKRRTGKSTFAKWMLQWYVDKFALAICMTQTPSSGYWQKFVGSAYTFPGYNPTVIQAVLDRNAKIMKACGGEDSEEAKAVGSTLFILDDIVSPELFDDELFIKLATEGRHHLCSVIILTQDPKAISPKIRDNCDIAVIFNQKTYRNKETIWHDFLNDVDRDTAWALMGKHCVEHNALIAIQTNLDGELTRNFQVSTGDKTKLDDENYILGGEKQKLLVIAEREKKKVEEKQRKIASKADQRPLKERGPDGMDASNFTAEKILTHS